jgi:hypothetical protein
MDQLSACFENSIVQGDQALIYKVKQAFKSKDADPSEDEDFIEYQDRQQSL